MTTRTAVLAALLVFAALIAPVSAPAKTDARCGLSAGAVVGPDFPNDPDLRDEFPFLYHITANAKYYFLKVFSISGDLGYEYGQGAPKRFVLDGEEVELDGRGTSFWRAMPFWGTIRLEPFRKWIFAPYVGGAGGGRYLVLDRSGREREIAKSNSADEWLFGWMALAGFDVRLDDFFFLRLEAWYSSTESTSQEFFEEKDYGTTDVLAGLNIYF
ncbi:MAG: outer membrane beta-barrel protein [Deltaproteobacteria bacterium]|nr:outer membrane beta-barrel protein [Deltaproteobacteria bacterium]